MDQRRCKLKLSTKFIHTSHFEFRQILNDDL
jgi:hypothetical protein